MRKKIASFVAAVFILLACVLSAGCGDKYKDMKFKVYYAFASDATVWYDGTDGISLNYDPEEIYVGGERTSLIFDANGEAVIFIKVEVENVKAKHVDLITVTSASGFISPIHIKEGQVASIPIKKDGSGNANLNTRIKLYENNSSKRYDMPFVVSRKLEGITLADPNGKPAVLTGGTLNLLQLDNLVYQPAGQTNQLGVKYSISFNGKARFTMDFATEAAREEIEAAVLANEMTQKYLDGKSIKKIIVVPKKIVNIVFG